MKHNYVPDGCFLIARQMFESAIWKDDPHVLKLFIYLIGKARHKEQPKKYPGFEVKQGELVTSLAQIAENNEFFNRRLQQWSRSKVSRMLAILKEQGYIEILADTYGTHIGICNYSLYQDLSNYKANTGETVVKRKRNASETEVGIYNNDNNGKNENKKDLVVEVIEHLNKICDKKYKAKADANIAIINARLNEGFTVDDLKYVIDVKSKQWKGDDKQDKYLRPETLFGKTKFQGYINEIMPKGEVYCTMPDVNGGEIDLYSKEEAEEHKLLLAKAASERIDCEGNTR